MVACAPQSAPTPTPILVLTTIVPPTATSLLSTPTQKPTLVSTTVVSTPKVQKICPCDRNVTFGDKDFLSTSQLIIKKDDAWGLMDMSNGKIQPKAKVDISFQHFFASPDYHSFAYMENGEQKFLWVFTAAATHSYELPPESDTITWVNNQDLAIWDFVPQNHCPSFVAFINVITGEETHPAHLPDLSKKHCVLQIPVINAQKSKIAYAGSKDNLINGKSAQLLGFPEITLGNGRTLDMAWVGDKLAVAYWDADYLLYGISLPDSTDASESVNFQIIKISLPELATSKDGWWESIVKLHQSEQSAIIGIDLIDKSVDPLDYLFQDKVVPTNFYTVDTAQQQIADYELDRAVFSKTQSGGLNFSYISPDERFLAWPIYEYTDESKIIGSLILDLKSGKVLSIPDVEVLGWFAP